MAKLDLGRGDPDFIAKRRRKQPVETPPSKSAAPQEAPSPPPVAAPDEPAKPVAVSARKKLTDQEIRALFASVRGEPAPKPETFAAAAPAARPPDASEDEHPLPGDLRDAEQAPEAATRPELVQAAPRETPPPVEPPPLAPGPAESGSLAERLEAARKNYVAAEKRFDQAGVTRTVLQAFIGTKSREKVQNELASANDEYRKVRAEYVGASIENHVAEQEKLLASQFAARAETVKHEKENLVTGWGKRYYEFHKSLGNVSLEKPLSKFGMGKLGRMMNARTGASMLLLGGGLWLGAGTAVGLGALAVRRAMGGAGTGFGMYDLSSMAARALERRRITRGMGRGKISLDDLNDNLASLEARAIMDGRSMEDLKNDEMYRGLLDRRLRTMESMKQLGLTDHPEHGGAQFDKDWQEFLDAQSNNANRELALRKWDIKGASFLRKAVAGAAGIFIGSGMMQEMVKGISGSSKAASELSNRPRVTETVVEVNPPPPSASPAEMFEPQPVTVPDTAASPQVETLPPSPGAVVDNPSVNVTAEPFEPKIVAPPDAVVPPASPDLIVHGGSRGLEGAMLDLQKSNPEKFSSMVKWLESQYGVKAAGGNTPEKLVHRYILNYAADQKLNPSSLDRILQGDVRIGAGGEVGIEDLKLGKPLARAAAETVTVEKYPVFPPNPSAKVPDLGLSARSAVIPEPEANISTAADLPKARPVGLSDLPGRPVHLPGQPPAGPSTEAVRSPGPSTLKSFDPASPADRAALEEMNRQMNSPEAIQKRYAETNALFEGSVKRYQEILDTTQVQDFLKYLHITPEDLSAVEAENVADFRRDFLAGSPQYQERYKGLARAVEILIKEGKWDKSVQRGKKIVEIAEHLAEVYREKK